ncbi:adaptin ear-binding coat-associated protein 1 NECAP-1 [Fistulina hepatica ATCC 64428]|nr:adaptin ear-binding coat-associated protein 1 NECAP-1 [Fistulina hepatica ATCC 64428]
MDTDDAVESILYIAREISVYKIPPLKVNEGHRAAEWGDLAAPLWKGRLRIIEKADVVALQFEDTGTGESFARAEYDPKQPSVEAVLDSSRYFVVRVEDAGRKAYIGLGFAERSDSFDFNVALQDYTKRWRALREPKSQEESVTTVPAGPRKDYTLKEGQTFSISIPGRTKASPTTGTLDSLLGSNKVGGAPALSPPPSGGTVPLLPPPPGSGVHRARP